MFFQAPPRDVLRGPNHYSRSWPRLVLSSWWECLSKTRIRYRQGLGPSQLPLRHIRSLYTPIRRIHSPCLRPRRQRPGGCRAADERDELATPHHSITSSAATSSLSGTVMPSILAVEALRISSNLLACTTGSSAGLAPLRMRPL